MMRSWSLDGRNDTHAMLNRLPSGRVITVAFLPAVIVTVDTLHCCGGLHCCDVVLAPCAVVSCGDAAIVAGVTSSGCVAFGVLRSSARSSRSACAISSVSSGVPCQLLSS